MVIDNLKKQFGIRDRIRFSESSNGTVTAHISNTHASASIVLRGAHVTHFQPVGAEPVLWVSRDAIYAPGKAIRGGIPVCWPWFADHPTDSSKPAHGFVRTAMWEVSETYDQPEYTELLLTLTDNANTHVLWPHSFQLQLRISISSVLRVSLTTTNTGTTPFVYGGALHSYFKVGDVRNTEVHGLQGTQYMDKLDNSAIKTQNGPIAIYSEVDRTFIDTSSTCHIHDPDMGRRIEIAKSGSQNTVVWNPWIEKSAGMADFANDEYSQMLCVESANADGDQIKLSPASRHTLETRISATMLNLR